ncbi:MAG: hypothetical protein ACOYLB_16975 [Phototrophicaceae bacterium]
MSVAEQKAMLQRFLTVVEILQKVNKEQAQPVSKQPIEVKGQPTHG